MAFIFAEDDMTSNRCSFSHGCQNMQDPRSGSLEACTDCLIAHLVQQVAEQDATREVHLNRIVELNAQVFRLEQQIDALCGRHPLAAN